MDALCQCWVFFVGNRDLYNENMVEKKKDELQTQKRVGSDLVQVLKLALGGCDSSLVTQVWVELGVFGMAFRFGDFPII